MKITDVKCGYIREGHGLFVEIHTNQDIWGCGEAVDATPGSYYLVTSFGRRIRGQDPLNVHPLAKRLRSSGLFEGAQSGIFVAVMTAVETALWDLAGKALGVPVYQLLGGKFRDRLRIYMDTALYQFELPKLEQFAESAKKVVDMGLPAMKFDLDQANDPNKYDRYNWTASPAEVPRMVDQMTAAREAVGANIDVCADMQGRYDLPTAQQVAKRLEPLNLMWLEEPAPAEKVDLRGREHLAVLRLSPTARDRRSRHYHTRPAERRRLGRGTAHCGPVYSLQRLTYRWEARAPAPRFGGRREG